MTLSQVTKTPASWNKVTQFHRTRITKLSKKAEKMNLVDNNPLINHVRCSNSRIRTTHRMCILPWTLSRMWKRTRLEYLQKKHVLAYLRRYKTYAKTKKSTGNSRYSWIKEPKASISNNHQVLSMIFKENKTFHLIMRLKTYSMCITDFILMLWTKCVSD